MQLLPSRFSAVARLSLPLLACSVFACTGATFGENGPGGEGGGPSLGTYLESGSIAVDSRNENTYVLATHFDRDTDVETKTLKVADLEATRASDLASLTGLDDLRIMFVNNAVMVMGERGVSEELILYDMGGTRETMRKSTDSRYHGTRVSQSGNFVAVADSNTERSPLHLIDTSDLSVRPIPHGGDWLEANWANTSDRLVAAVFYKPEFGGEAATGTLRIMSWSLNTVVANEYGVDEEGFWLGKDFDVFIPNADSDPLFSFSWVSVSKDDRYAVVPMLHRSEDETGNSHRLAVVELATGDLRIVDDARGPVGFTPDGSTIVSYRSVLQDDGTTKPHLLMLDAETLEGELLDEPSPGLIQFFVTRDGNFVIVGDFFGSSELTLVDLDGGGSTKLGRPLDLNEFVSRPGTGELYLVDEGLFRLDTMSATLEEVPLSFTPAHINRLPSDQLVIDNPSTEELIFLNPDSGETVRRVEL